MLIKSSCTIWDWIGCKLEGWPKLKYKKTLRIVRVIRKVLILNISLKTNVALLILGINCILVIIFHQNSFCRFLRIDWRTFWRQQRLSRFEVWPRVARRPWRHLRRSTATTTWQRVTMKSPSSQTVTAAHLGDVASGKRFAFSLIH